MWFRLARLFRAVGDRDPRDRLFGKLLSTSCTSARERAATESRQSTDVERALGFWAQGRVREDPKEFKVHPCARITAVILIADPLGTSHGRRYHRDQLSMSLVHVVLAHYAAGLRALASGSLASVRGGDPPIYR